MKALVEGFMSQKPVAYALFGVGAFITLILEMLGQPSLIFALGMYLPLELNTPALVGGFLSHFLNKRASKKNGEHGRTIRERVVIIALGLMACGALGGVFGAAILTIPSFKDIFSAVAFIALCVYFWFSSMRKPKEIIWTK